MEVIEEALNVGVAFQIDVGVRMPVAREEFLNAKGISGVARANECCIANTLHQQLHPPKNERAHQDLAQLRVRLQQCKEAFAGELDDFSVLPCSDTRHCTTTRTDVDFTGELTCPDNQKKRFDCVRW